MFCKNCGSQIPDTAVFCPNCGNTIVRSGQEPQQQDRPIQQNYQQNQNVPPQIQYQQMQYQQGNNNGGKKNLIIILIVVIVAALIGSVAAMKFMGIGPFAPEETVSEADDREGNEKDEEKEDEDDNNENEDKDDEQEGEGEAIEDKKDEEEEPEEEKEVIHTYEVIVDDVTWTEAKELAEEAGGHLATITSKKEEKKIIKKAEKAGITYLWIGGRTGFDDDENVEFKWITGEDVDYENWFEGEPSGMDMSDNDILEPYVMLWYVRDAWSWNDQRDELAYNNNDAISKQYMGKMGYVIEYEEEED